MADGAARQSSSEQVVILSLGEQGSGADTCTPPADPHPTPAAHTSRTIRGPVLALRVPANERTPLTLVRLAASAVAFSDAIGGGYLEEVLDGAVDGCAYVVLLDERRVAKGLPVNQRAAVLAARLGHVNRQWLAGLCGDALVMGCGRGWSDTDVPDGVVDAARQSGLLLEHDQPEDRRAR